MLRRVNTGGPSLSRTRVETDADQLKPRLGAREAEAKPKARVTGAGTRLEAPGLTGMPEARGLIPRLGPGPGRFGDRGGYVG
jgi:hypothetical protein